MTAQEKAELRAVERLLAKLTEAELAELRRDAYRIAHRKGFF